MKTTGQTLGCAMAAFAVLTVVIIVTIVLLTR